MSNFRIIPRFEDDLAVVALVQRPAGRVLLLGIFIAGLWLSGVYDVVWLSPMLFLGILFPWRARRWISFFHLAALWLSSSAFMVTDRKTYHLDFFVEYAKHRLSQPPGAVWPVKLVALLGAAFFCAAAWRFVKRSGEWREADDRRWIIPVVYLLICFVFAWSAPSGLLGVVIAGILILSSKFLLYLLMSAPERDVPVLGRLFPLWAQSGLPLTGTACDTAEELARCQIRGVKLLTWGLVLMAGAWAAKQCTHRMGIPLLIEVGLIGVQGRGAGFGWVVAVSTYLVGLLAFSARLAVYVSVARMFGYSLKRGIYRPLESRSLNEFFRRTNHFFCEVVVGLFFYPIWDFLGRLGVGRTARMFLTVLVTVAGGGAAIRIIQEIQLVIGGGQFGGWGGAVRIIIYYIFIGSLSGVSALARRWVGGGVPTIIRALAFTAIFSFAVILIADPACRDEGLRWRFILSLLGLGS